MGDFYLSTLRPAVQLGLAFSLFASRLTGMKLSGIQFPSSSRQCGSEGDLFSDLPNSRENGEKSPSDQELQGSNKKSTSTPY